MRAVLFRCTVASLREALAGLDGDRRVVFIGGDDNDFATDIAVEIATDEIPGSDVIVHLAMAPKDAK